MRDSAARAVTVLSGKIRIHNAAPRLVYLVIVRRVASICLEVIHVGSNACRPYLP